MLIKLLAHFLSFGKAARGALGWEVTLHHLEPIRGTLEIFFALGALRCRHGFVSFTCAAITPEVESFFLLFKVVLVECNERNATEIT